MKRMTQTSPSPVPPDLAAERAQEKARQLRRMKAIALGALLLAVALLALSHYFGRQGAWAWVGAFAEAATVGALADWFAVVALFRHPLGLPIPHTAIIPRKQARLGQNLADFICTHFLATPQVMAKLEAFDAAARLAGWLRQPAHAEGLAGHLVGVARYGIQALRDERLLLFVQAVATSRLRQVDFARFGGQLLELLTHERRHQAVLDELLDELDALLQDEAVQQRIAAGLSGEFSALRLRLFGKDIPLIHESGLVGIGFSLFVVVIAALNLVLDFDFIERGVERQCPKYMEWYAAFGLMVTLVWLYLELLRLLSKLQSRD